MDNNWAQYSISNVFIGLSHHMTTRAVHNLEAKNTQKYSCAEKYQIEKKMHRQECFACLEDFLSGIQTCFVCLAVSWPDTVTTSSHTLADLRISWNLELIYKQPGQVNCSQPYFWAKDLNKEIWINGRQKIMKWKSLYLQRKSSIRFLQLGPTGRASA